MRDRLLKADDFHVGQFVIVRGISRREETADSFDIGPLKLMQMVSMSSPTVDGHPLEVLAVDLPFLAVRCISCNGAKHSLDTRNVELIEASPTFVAAMRRSKWWQFWRK